MNIHGDLFKGAREVKFDVGGEAIKLTDPRHPRNAAWRRLQEERAAMGLKPATPEDFYATHVGTLDGASSLQSASEGDRR